MGMSRRCSIETNTNNIRPGRQTGLPLPQLSTIAVRLDGAIAEISLNRPERSNALNEAMWQELRESMLG